LGLALALVSAFFELTGSPFGVAASLGGSCRQVWVESSYEVHALFLWLAVIFTALHPDPAYVLSSPSSSSVLQVWRVPKTQSMMWPDVISCVHCAKCSTSLLLPLFAFFHLLRTLVCFPFRSLAPPVGTGGGALT